MTALYVCSHKESNYFVLISFKLCWSDNCLPTSGGGALFLTLSGLPVPWAPGRSPLTSYIGLWSPGFQGSAHLWEWAFSKAPLTIVQDWKWPPHPSQGDWLKPWWNSKQPVEIASQDCVCFGDTTVSQTCSEGSGAEKCIERRFPLWVTPGLWAVWTGIAKEWEDHQARAGARFASDCRPFVLVEFWVGCGNDLSEKNPFLGNGNGVSACQWRSRAEPVLFSSGVCLSSPRDDRQRCGFHLKHFSGSFDHFEEGNPNRLLEQFSHIKRVLCLKGLQLTNGPFSVLTSPTLRN